MLKFIFPALFIAMIFPTMTYADAPKEATELCRNPVWVEGVVAKEIEVLLAQDRVVIFNKEEKWERNIEVSDIIDAQPEPEFVDMWDTIYRTKEAVGIIVVFLVIFEGKTFIHLNQPRTSNGESSCFRTLHEIRDLDIPSS